MKTLVKTASYIPLKEAKKATHWNMVKLNGEEFWIPCEKGLKGIYREGNI